ncbi:MAG TPA: exodeoxyribonuclease III [Thermohalobaculum sp.]|nr:exodeoxyribonuclease III [Thermohalobaculum sp.]
MKIATYNINGIKARLPALLEWLSEAQPDVALLQEIKSVDEGFPRPEIEELGYNVETHGQKGFNGVAILSKHPIEDVTRGLPSIDGDDESDEQARWIEATIVGARDAVRVCGLYLPNGNPAHPPESRPKYDYKLAWMERLAARAKDLIASEEIALMAGDYNVIPDPRDAENPKNWQTDALFLPETRAAWRRIVNLGFTDALRETTQADHVYSFWDYQRGAWERNDGIRIDHLLLTPQAADRLTAAGIDSTVRGREKPSDHVPVWIDIDI